jgi:uncharacterized protein YdiU (UPF0061 family)
MQTSQRHTELPSNLYCPVRPANFPHTNIIYSNTAWAKRLKMQSVLNSDKNWENHFGRFQPFDGAQAEPLALCYHGHQFGVYNPDLGDGRGFLFAQCVDPVSGRLLDFGTKGSGQTPFSRSADGRLTLKGAVRELLATEMLDALGVNTSKTFAILETGESLTRHDEPSPTRSAVLTRLSHGHIRIGSFQRLVYLRDHTTLEALIRYALSVYYHDEDADQLPITEAAERLLLLVAENMAHLVASWLAAGFVHGVLNTDNFNISGESFDYGPWRFLSVMDPGFTAAYFDHQSRYCYGRQPEATFWALCRLADCFVPFLEVERLKTLVGRYHDVLETAVVAATCRRLGIDSEWDKASAMVAAFMAGLRSGQMGYDEACFDWYGGSARDAADKGKRKALYQASGFAEAADLLRSAPPAKESNLEADYFAKDDPVHLRIEKVEAIWAPIAAEDDWSELVASLRAIHDMAEAYAMRDEPAHGRLLDQSV